MLSVAEAEGIILSHLFKPLKQTIAIQSSPGKILAEEIKADRDFPPFNRAAMDGIAASKRPSPAAARAAIQGRRRRDSPR